MFDHISITVSDLKASDSFYSAALALLGLKKLFEVTAEMRSARASPTLSRRLFRGIRV
jgi:catechol 2,3-dioxygenase-like lactoylglutathione lyase family enzyme